VIIQMAIRLSFMFVRAHMLEEGIAHGALETSRMVSRAHRTDDTADDGSMASTTNQSATAGWARAAHMRLRRGMLLVLLLLLLWLPMSMSLPSMHNSIIIRSRDIDTRSTMMTMTMVVEIRTRNANPRNLEHLNVVVVIVILKPLLALRPSRISVYLDHRWVDVDERHITAARVVGRRVDVDHRRLYSRNLGSRPPTILGIAPVIAIRLELRNIRPSISTPNRMRRFDTDGRKRSRCLRLMSSSVERSMSQLVGHL